MNHLHGHIFAPFLDAADEPAYPFLALLVSGGHSQLVHVDGPSRMRILGGTRDDAAGEAFDKTARLLGFPYPGGPEIDRLARDGRSRRRWLSREPGRRAARSTCRSRASRRRSSYFLESPAGRDAVAADVAASFQAAVVDVLMDRTDRAAQRGAYRTAVLSGGVAANSALQRAFARWGERPASRHLVPPLALLHRQRRDDRRRRRSPRRSRARRRAHADGNPSLPFEPPASSAA